MSKIKFEKNLKACFNDELDKNVLNKDLVVFIDSLCNSKSLPFSAVFSGILAATSSICSKSTIKVYKDSNDFNCPFTLFLVNTGLASSNKSCCTDLIKDSYHQMEKFLDTRDENNFIISALDNSATIESLLEKLNIPPHSRFQVWDELATLSESFGLYKPGAGSWDKSFFLSLYNAPKSFLHSTKKYSYHIPDPRLVIFASSHPETMMENFSDEQRSASAFWCRFLVHVFRANRIRLDEYVPFNGRFTLDILFSCIKVIHSSPLFYIFSEEGFTYVSDVCWEFDNIAEANEIHLQYIAYIYGKSKSHFIRIAGCLWALDISFKILSQIDPIPTNKDEFIAAVLNELSLIESSNIIEIHVVKMAVKVMDYFISHKLILSDMEKNEESGEYVFINKASELKAKKSGSLSSTSTLLKTVISLENRILSTPGPLVLLTPLSRAKHCTKTEFIIACKALVAKNLGTLNEKVRLEGATRASIGFQKSIVPKEPDQNAFFVNALFDFNCGIDVYSNTLTQDNILPPPPTPTGNTKENDDKVTNSKSSGGMVKKRVFSQTSIENIANLQKNSRSEKNHEDSDDEDS